MKKERFGMKNYALALFLPVLFSALVFADDASFTASVDKTTIAVDEQFTLQFTLNGSGMSGGKDLKLPDLSKFLLLSGPNQSTSMQIINGSVSSSATYSYILQPRETGDFTIGAGSIEEGGKQYYSQPIHISVVKGSAKPKQQSAATQQSGAGDVNLGDDLFLRAVVDRSRVYQGEQVTVTFKVYTRVRIANYSLDKLPSMTGFWGEDLSVPQQVNLTNEVVNGKQYQVGVLKKMALFPTQAGTLEINPLEIVCQVQMQNRRKNGDWFDQFFNDPFSSVTTSNVRIKSPPVKITVLPLPKTGVPVSFKGAVGKFGLDVALSSSNVKTNEPVSLKATISGTGNIKILEAPNIEVPQDFEKYDPKVTENIDRNGSAVNGSKTFEWLLVPRYPGVKKIPPLEFSYYDLSKGKYVSLHSNPIEVSVEKGSAEAAPMVTGISKEDVKLLNQDIRFIKTSSSSFESKGEDVVSPATFAVCTIIPLLAFVGLAAYKQKTLRESSDSISFRSRKAIKIATKRLKEAKNLLASDNAEAFYAETSRAVWAYVADKLAIDRAELSIDNVTQTLMSREISVELVARIKECLEACEFARFAPSSSSQTEKQKMYDAASGVIVAAEKELSK